MQEIEKTLLGLDFELNKINFNWVRICVEWLGGNGGIFRVLWIPE